MPVLMVSVTMKYTALIVTFNRLGKLKKTVEETLKLEFTNIVIVNNGSTDGDPSLAFCQLLIHESLW